MGIRPKILYRLSSDSRWLTWDQRANITVLTAKALVHLHGFGVVHKVNGLLFPIAKVINITTL